MISEPRATAINAEMPERKPSERVEGYDLARALAYFGMVFVHFRICVSAKDAGPTWLGAMVDQLDGRAAATFVTLAGVGMSLMARPSITAGDRAELAKVRLELLRRAAFLFVLGLLYFEIWPADILHCYGVYLAIGTLLLTADSRALWSMAVGFVLAYLPLIVMFDYSEGWDWSTLSYRGFWTPTGLLRNLFFNGFNPVIPWTAFLLLGIALGRLDLLDLRVRRRVVGAGLGAAILGEALSRILLHYVRTSLDQTMDAEETQAMFGTEPMPPLPLFMIVAAGVAHAVIGLSVAAAERWKGALWLSALVRTGRMAFTLYVAHVVIGLGTLEGLGWLQRGSVTLAVASAAVFCLVSVIFAVVWSRHFPRGPLEWVMRRIAAN